jgi:phospholipid/cholesterol/gamma-HCH transport system ATP-binding protein
MNQTSAEIFTLYSDKKEISTESVIDVQNLKIGFGHQEVLKDVSFKLRKGENLVILGKSGTGKSVLIKCISALLRPDYGKITVLGEEVNALKGKELAQLRKKIGFLFQSGALYDSMTVKENLEFPLNRADKKLSKDEKHEKILSVLENVGLKEALHKMPSELSGGMRKRIALARTLIVDPVIMLYDEPTTGLDPLTSREISKLINEVKQKYHTSSVIITHDMDCARETADRVIILKDGMILAEGEVEELENSEDEWIRAFFGKT